ERLEVPPGQQAMARVSMRAPRPDGSQQVSRHITVTAWNGPEVCEARIPFVPSASDRRPMARTTLTALGSAAIMLGTFQPWTPVPITVWPPMVHHQLRRRRGHRRPADDRPP